MNAAQGDGEICGCGIEISGDVLLSCSIIKKQQEKNEYPITETATKWITHGVAVEDIPAATKLACEEAAALLVNEWGFTYEDAPVYLGVAGNLGLCQSIHPCQGTVIAKMSVPKIADIVRTGT
jgi:amidase